MKALPCTMILKFSVVCSKTSNKSFLQFLLTVNKNECVPVRDVRVAASWVSWTTATPSWLVYLQTPSDRYS